MSDDRENKDTMDTRTCRQCGSTFTKRYRESAVKFNGRYFCLETCRMKFNKKSKAVKALSATNYFDLPPFGETVRIKGFGE